MFGVLPVDKPAGLTSRDVCNQVARLVRPHKLGHTGTLDPLATGVLLLAVGRAARLVEFSLGHSKDYTAEFELGCRSDTLDVDGNVEQLPNPPAVTLAELRSEARKWIGCVNQVPPKYSAINLGGRRAHDLARQGKEFQLAARPVAIHAIEVDALVGRRWSARVTCGSGTYIRALGSDIARGLGSDAVMVSLVRTRVGPFSLDDCAKLDQLLSPSDVSARLRPPQLLLADMPTVRLSREAALSIRNGIPLQLDNVAERLSAVDEHEELVAVLQRVGDARNSSAAEQCTYRSLRVFHTASETHQPSRIKAPQSPES